MPFNPQNKTLLSMISVAMNWIVIASFWRLIKNRVTLELKNTLKSIKLISISAIATFQRQSFPLNFLNMNEVGFRFNCLQIRSLCCVFLLDSLFVERSKMSQKELIFTPRQINGNRLIFYKVYRLLVFYFQRDLRYKTDYKVILCILYKRW